MLKQRVMTSLILFALILTLLKFSDMPFVLNVAVALLSAGAVYEVLLATKYIETKGLMVVSIGFAVAIPFIQNINIVGLITVLFTITIILFLSVMINGGQYNFEHISVVYLVSVMIPFFFTTLIYIRNMEKGEFYICLVLLGAFMTDIAAYFIGKFFGKTKIAPEISPKKTLEGFIGGTVITTISFGIFGVVVSGFWSIEINYPPLLVCGLFAAIFSQVGDLSISIIKRKFGIKDFGSLMPGHGGILDRFDSVLFASPFIFVFISLFNYLTIQVLK